MFKSFGEILSVTEPKRHFSFIEYPNIMSALGAIEALDGEYVNGKRIVVNFSQYRKPTNCLWLGHIAAAAFEEDIIEFCARHIGMLLKLLLAEKSSVNIALGLCGHRFR